MVSKALMEKYARVAVRIGANVQPGQLLVLSAPVQAAEFARMCMTEAYAAGAQEVYIQWKDEQCERLRYIHEDMEVMSRVPDWRKEMERSHIARKCCFLHIEASTPGLLAGLDSKKIQAVRVARLTAMKPFDYYTLNNRGQWSIVAYPTAEWAKKVFPEKTEEAALSALWQAVLSAVRVTEDNDPVADWRRHGAALLQNSRRLNEYGFHSLHFQNALGTDLRVELVKNHVWAGGSARAADVGVDFIPNLPTEEVFTMPYKYGAEGIVYATKPLDYRGMLAEGFWFRFEKGRVVDYGAEKGIEAIENLLGVDEGSRYLGEVALIAEGTPVSKQGILFLNTLFDENASCHLALGEAYPENLRGGGDMTQQQLREAGANDSVEHCDFMFGSADLSVTGRAPDGGRVEIIRDGRFVSGAGFAT